MSITRNVVNLGNLIRRKPLLFNSIIYGSFYTGAEFAQQSYNLKFQLEQRSQRDANAAEFIAIGASVPKKDLDQSNVITRRISTDYDWPTLQRYGIYGCFIAGPMLHGWYKWLDRRFRGTAIKTIMVKLVADQFILTPPLIILFFISMSCMEGRSDIFQECKLKFANTFQTSCMYWIPVQFVNFMVVPPALRVLYVSVAAFCWVNILCYLKRMPLPPSESDSLKNENS